MSSISSVQTAGSGIYSQLQQQRAEQAADQAEQNARSLQAQARDARSAADRAEASARSLDVQSEQASNQASRDRLNLASASSMKGVQVPTDTRVQQTAVTNGVAPPVAAPVAVQAAPVLNAQGQTTGRLINVQA